MKVITCVRAGECDRGTAKHCKDRARNQMGCSALLDAGAWQDWIRCREGEVGEIGNCLVDKGCMTWGPG